MAVHSEDSLQILLAAAFTVEAVGFRFAEAPLQRKDFL